MRVVTTCEGFSVWHSHIVIAFQPSFRSADRFCLSLSLYFSGIRESGQLEKG